MDGGSNPPSSTKRGSLEPLFLYTRGVLTAVWTAVVGRADGKPRTRPAPLTKGHFKKEVADNRSNYQRLAFMNASTARQSAALGISNDSSSTE